MVFRTKGEHSGQHNIVQDDEFVHDPKWSFMACLGKKHSLLNIPNNHNNCVLPGNVHLRPRKNNCILGCIKSSGQGLREVILPLCSAQVRLYLECCVQFWGTQYKKDMNLQIQRMLNEMEHLYC